MGSLENIEIEVLKETVIYGYEKEFDIVLTQSKQTDKGVTMYKIFSELKYDGKLYDILQTLVAFTREIADYYFSQLESKYLEEMKTRKIS